MRLSSLASEEASACSRDPANQAKLRHSMEPAVASEAGPQLRAQSWKPAKPQHGHVLTASGWLDSARGCAFSAQGSSHSDHPSNQDAILVLEGFSGIPGSTLCALMDGHGPQGHIVAQAVRSSLPCLLSRKLPAAAGTCPGAPEDLCGAHSGLGICDDCSERYESSSEGSWCGSDSSSPRRSCSAARAPSELACDLPEATTQAEPWCDGAPDASSSPTSDSSTTGPDSLGEPGVESESSSGDSVVPNSVFEEAFAAVNDRVRHNPEIYPLCSGSTAVVALIAGNQLTVAHVGDSRCVLGMRGRQGQHEAIQVTVDHTPLEPVERKRVEAHGGRVLALKHEPEVARVWLPEGCLPGLAITRAIGDEIVKEYGVVCTPEVMRIMLDDSAEFLILGSEGLWNVMSNAQAVGLVGKCRDRVQAAERLVMVARRKWLKQHGPGRVDDVTAVVYFFKPLEISL